MRGGPGAFTARPTATTDCARVEGIGRPIPRRHILGRTGPLRVPALCVADGGSAAFGHRHADRRPGCSKNTGSDQRSDTCHESEEPLTQQTHSTNSNRVCGPSRASLVAQANHMGVSECIGAADQQQGSGEERSRQTQYILKMRSFGGGPLRKLPWTPCDTNTLRWPQRATTLRRPDRLASAGRRPRRSSGPLPIARGLLSRTPTGAAEAQMVRHQWHKQRSSPNRLDRFGVGASSRGGRCMPSWPVVLPRLVAGGHPGCSTPQRPTGLPRSC
jgi:hypothetical protein